MVAYLFPLVFREREPRRIITRKYPSYIVMMQNCDLRAFTVMDSCINCVPDNLERIEESAIMILEAAKPTKIGHDDELDAKLS